MASSKEEVVEVDGSGGCSVACRNEFKPSNFGLEFNKPDLFVYNQWSQRPSIWFVMYRVLFTSYFLAIFIYQQVVYEFRPRWKYFILLTHWCYILLVISLVVITIGNVVAYIHGRNAQSFPVYDQVKRWMKVMWVFNNMAFPSALTVTVLYWVIVYKPATFSLDIRNVTTHAVNSFYVVLDVWVTGMPVRWYHFYHTMLYGAAWTTFTIIYWAAGGTNEHDDPYIYSVIDYGGNPARAVGYIIFVVVVIVLIFHSVHFGIYKLRNFIWDKCYKGRRANFNMELGAI